MFRCLVTVIDDNVGDPESFINDWTLLTSGVSKWVSVVVEKSNGVRERSFSRNWVFHLQPILCLTIVLFYLKSWQCPILFILYLHYFTFRTFASLPHFTVNDVLRKKQTEWVNFTSGNVKCKTTGSPCRVVL